MSKFIMSFDVISSNRKQIKLTGDSKLIFIINNPSKEMYLKAKKNEVVIVFIDEMIHNKDKSITLKADEIMTFKELKNKGYL